MRKLFLLFCLFLSTLSAYSVASDLRMTPGETIMEHIFSQYGKRNFLVKYRDDERFVGVLVVNDDNVGNALKVFNVHTQEQVFEFTDQEKKVVNFKFKKDAVVIFYKSTFWEERIAYDLYTGRVVRRYSSWFGYKS